VLGGYDKAEFVNLRRQPLYLLRQHSRVNLRCPVRGLMGPILDAVKRPLDSI
jgi:hypothetical protein